MKKLLEKGLANPIGFPTLAEAVYPGDRVVLATDRFSMENGAIPAAVLEFLVERGITPDDITVLFRDDEVAENEEKAKTSLKSSKGKKSPAPKTSSPKPPVDVALRALLPKEWADRIVFHRFTPHQSDSCSILGLTEEGEPIALARSLVDADVVLPLERHHPVSPVGHYGPLSVIVPRFSDLVTQIRFQGADGVKNREKIVEPLADEIARTSRLLGVLMVLEIIADSSGNVTEFVFGDPAAVTRDLTARNNNGKLRV